MRKLTKYSLILTCLGMNRIPAVNLSMMILTLDSLWASSETNPASIILFATECRDLGFLNSQCKYCKPNLILHLWSHQCSCHLLHSIYNKYTSMSNHLCDSISNLSLNSCLLYSTDIHNYYGIYIRIIMFEVHFCYHSLLWHVLCILIKK